VTGGARLSSVRGCGAVGPANSEAERAVAKAARSPPRSRFMPRPPAPPAPPKPPTSATSPPSWCWADNRCTTRCEVYSLGATLYELLTLRPVFDGRDHQVLPRQIAQDEPIPRDGSTRRSRWYIRALDWQSRYPASDPALDALRTEAERLLGRPSAIDPGPKPKASN